MSPRAHEHEGESPFAPLVNEKPVGCDAALLASDQFSMQPVVTVAGGQHLSTCEKIHNLIELCDVVSSCPK